MSTPESTGAATEPGQGGPGHLPAMLTQCRPARWTGFLFFGLAFIYLTARSWRKWPEILVDYGSQLYVPWQLSTGKVLYRDVMYLPGGPLSQYFDAVLFRFFGVSFTTLIVANLCLIALFFWLLYDLFKRATSAFSAALICFVVLFTFAFSQNSSDGNYNFVSPYCHESFHGLLLSVATIACLWRWLTTNRTRPALWAGLFYGCVFLTKPDLFLALSLTLPAVVFIRHTQLFEGHSPDWKSLLFLLPGALLPSVLFLAYYTVVWNFFEGLKAVANAWIPLLTTQASNNAYYKWCLGLDTPWIFAAAIAYYTAYALVGVAFLAVAARHLKRGGINAVVVVVLLIFALYKTWNMEAWNSCGQALLPLTVLGTLWVGRRWWQRRHTPDGVLLVFPLLWSVFALFLLAKMGLFTRLWHYGFYLAMPATAFVLLLLIWLLPRELARFQVDPTIFRLLVVIFLAWGEAQLVGMSNIFFKARVCAVGDGPDRIYTPAPIQNPLGDSIQKTLVWLRESTSPTNTLAVLPEGAMVNYLARRINPTPYTVFCPPEVQAYGESNMAAAFAQNSPDYILLVHRNSSEYGVKLFGQEPGYGCDLMHWIRTHYSPLWLLGQMPLKETNQFGILMLKRNEQQSPNP